MSESAATVNSASPAPNTVSQAPVATTEAPNAAPNASASQDAKAPEKCKVKVDGKEVEVTREQLMADYQLKQASYKRMEEAHKARSQAEAQLKAIEEDPIRYLQSKNKNAREIAEKYLAAELRKEAMSPEQREIMEWRARDQQQKQQEAAKQQTEQQKQASAATNEAAQRYDQEITQLVTTGPLPKTAYSVKRIANKILTFHEQTGEWLSSAEAYEEVVNEHYSDLTAAAKGLKGEALLKFLGEDVAAEIRRADLGRLKANSAAKPKESSPRREVKPAQPKHQSIKDWRSIVDSKRIGNK